MKRSFVLIAGLLCAGTASDGSQPGPLLAMPQQNIEVSPPPTGQNVERSHSHHPTSADKTWSEAADEAMKAIDATERLTAKDRNEMAKREKDQSPRNRFLLRLKILQELASR